MLRRWVTRVLVASLVALGLPIAAGLSPASASPGFIDGGFAMSTVINCQSLGVLGTPYTETGITTYTGYYGDLTASTPTPKVGDTFYVHVVISAPGNPCPNQYVWVDVKLPTGLTPAISAGNPLNCYLDGSLVGGCDASHVVASPFHAGAYSIINATDGVFNHEIWQVQTGHIREFNLPVTASQPIINQTLHAYVSVLDGNDNPTLDATAQMLVQSSAPPAAPQIFFASPSTEITLGATPTYKSVGQIRTNVAGSARFRIGTTTAYSISSDSLGSLPAGSWQAWDDWTPFVPVAGTVYHWTLCFTPSGGSEICGADQTFTGIAADGTPPTLVSVTPLAPSFSGNSAAVRVTFSEPVTGIANGLIMSTNSSTPTLGSPIISPASGFAKVFNITIPVTGLGTGDFGIGIANHPSIKDAAGNSMTGSGASTTVHINRAIADTTKPVIASGALPVVSLGTVTQTWTASDNVGLSSFGVAARTITSAGVVGAFGKAAGYGAAVRSAPVGVIPGTTRCAQVTAYDTSNNSAAAPQRCTVTPFDERKVRSAGVWAALASATAYARTLSRSVRVGSTKYLTGVKGHSIVVVAQKARGAGIVQILLNGRLIYTWSLAATKTIPKSILRLPVAAGFNKATVVVRVKAAGTTGVVLDGFGVGA